MTLHLNIEKPTLLLDRVRAIRNIEKMVAKAKASGVRFRPHFKTHQSAVIGEWFRERGVSAITVSSVDMAAYFAAHGWNDITLAFPANLRQLRAINELAGRIRLNLLLESAETAARLSRGLEHTVEVWLKIDTGYHRTGLAWDDIEGIVALGRAVVAAPHLRLAGLLTHAGHTYQTGSPAEVAALYEETRRRLKEVQAALRREGMEAAVSVGDTPGCSIVDHFGDVDEVRPGNFVFYDLVQLGIGSCEEEEIAVVVACPVVAKHVAAGKLVIYGGAVHLSRDWMMEDGQVIYGRVARLLQTGWSRMVEGARVVSLSQEHGIIQGDAALLEDVEVGDVLAVLPVHSCLTANLLQRYLTLEGQWIEMAHLFC